MKKILIVTNDYPSKYNIYANAFVHARAVCYVNEFEVRVLVCKKNVDNIMQYVYDGVSVQVVSDRSMILAHIKSYSPNVIAIHFVSAWMLDIFIRKVSCPIFIWIHGVEALGWYRRLFNFNILHIKEFLAYIKNNTLQLWGLRKIISYSNRNKKVQFVFVSKWMKRITEFDTGIKIKYECIIPNPIDSDLFKYSCKDVELRKRILLIRPFESRKYANDVAINAILELSKRPFFQDLEFFIYGKGRLFEPLTSKIKGFNNVTVINSYIEHKLIPEIHKLCGIFLCPTRQDAQGVSMCEAMSSGLVVVTSNNTAIPEFVEDNVTGILTHNSIEIADKIEYLYYHADVFQRISRNAASQIRKIAGHEYIISQEVSLLSSKIE